MREIYFASKTLYKITGICPPPWKTPHIIDGKPVLFVHIPKSAGSSLKVMLGCAIGKTTHTMPRLAMRKSDWLNSFIITSVRHPFDRFISSYNYIVKKQGSGVLNRMYGEELAKMDPMQYLAFIEQFPEKLGLQTQWTQYPSKSKPTADLILRVEQSALWQEQLQAIGLSGELTVVHKNASRDAHNRSEDSLGLTLADFNLLKRDVEKVFASDYKAFSY